MNKKYTKYMVLSAAAIVMIILVTVSIMKNQKAEVKDSGVPVESASTVMNSESTENSLLLSKTAVSVDEKTQSEVEKLITNYYDTSKKVNKKLIESESSQENSQTIKEINEKREGIESYKNIKTYARPGLEENAYVVFTVYEMKFYNIKTLAPGMSVLYVEKDENDQFAILDRPEDDQLNEYINELSGEEEIAVLILDVNTRLKEAMEKDKDLKSFVESLENITEKDTKKEKSE